MRGFTLARFTLAVTVAGSVILGAGVSGASNARTSRLPAGPRVPRSGGQVNLTAYSDNDGPTSVAVLTGAIGDFGKAVRTAGPSGQGDGELELNLTRGSFGLNIVKIENTLQKSIYGHFPTNANTCSGQISVEGSAPIVSGSGTHAYTGIQGSLKMSIRINEVETFPTCPTTDTSPFLAQSVFITGYGVVTLR